MTKLMKSQKKKYGPKTFKRGGETYSITAVARHDDECGNGHNSFSITGTILTLRGEFDSGGCIHEEIAKHLPELAPFVMWHLCSTDGPMHYVANTVYLAGDRDCNGLRAGERRQLINGKSGLPSWKLSEKPEGFTQYKDSAERPTETYVVQYEPWERVGEGKPRELDAARRTAIWPEATDEELTSPDLAERLKARLPELMVRFQKAVESLGLEY